MAGGFFDGLYSGITNPLFLGGVGLMAGGAEGLNQGLFAGTRLQDQRKKEVQSAALLKSVQGMPGLSDTDKEILGNSPDLALSALGEMYKSRFDPMADLRKRTAEANLAQTQAETGMLPLRQQLLRSQIAQVNQRGDGVFNQRAAAASAFGLDPNSDAGRSYILTGKLPREDQQALTATDKKAILEADENVGTNRAAIQAIDEAKRYNNDANAGWLANTRAQVGANLPDWLVPDFVSSPKSAEATLNFDNAVVGQALTQLKAIFGGNPTEGERKILLDLQGSSGKPAAVRAEILDRARRLADARLKLNEQRSTELRGGSYYKPGGGSAASNPMAHQSSAGDPLAEAKAAIAKGADPSRVMQRLQQMGIDPRGLQ